MDFGGKDVGHRRAGPTAVPEARAPAEHDEACPFLHSLHEQSVLLWCQVAGRQVAEDIDVIFSHSELGVLHLAGLPVGGTTNHDPFQLDVRAAPIALIKYL